MITMRAIFAALLLLLSFRVPNIYRHWTDGFSPSKIVLDYPALSSWSIPIEPIEREKIETILNQPFFYLSKGRQFFVFESKDGLYVLKIFRHDAYKFSKWKKQKTLEERLSRIFKSALLSYTKLFKETGLVWISLNPISSDRVLQLQDKIGRWHAIAARSCRFVLQKKALPFEIALRNAHEHDRARFDRMVQSFQQLLSSLNEKDIVNRDPKLRGNFGFVGETAIQLDIGSVEEIQGAPLHSMAYFQQQFDSWLNRECQ